MSNYNWDAVENDLTDPDEAYDRWVDARLETLDD
jgi:hypothetical protein